MIRVVIDDKDSYSTCTSNIEAIDKGQPRIKTDLEQSLGRLFTAHKRRNNKPVTLFFSTACPPADSKPAPTPLRV